ncbi:PKD domain-containing protein [Kosakonia cowanii]|uniref:PKD domain-containing protein n=1 Tax=Kosakonia cowanii TaxID=208223 RepID=UPI00289DBE29|nr:glycosyl hydrolase family 18 protein [Kosakonia cowanii]
MKKLSLAALIGSVLLTQSVLAAENNRIMSYLTSWGLPQDAATQLEKSNVDTFFLSFGGWNQNGEISSSDNIIKPAEYDPYWLSPSYTSWTQTKLAAPSKRMLVAFGGETYERMWGYIADAASREKIAQGLVKLLKTDFPVYKKDMKPEEMVGGCLSANWDKTCNMASFQKAGTVQLDGIDFDYEKVARLTPQENQNLLILAKRVKSLLGPNSGKVLSLTTYHVGADPESCASPSVMENCSFIEDARSAHHGEVLGLLTAGRDVFDFFNVMTYDAGPRFRYDVAMANYARAVGDKKKIILGNTINSQWGPEGRYVESKENNLTRAAWQAEQGYGGVFVWALGSNNVQLSFPDQVSYLNEMKQAAGGDVPQVENHIPVANAVYPQTVTGAATVVLDGSASTDPEGAALSWSWTQVSGPHVTLTNANQQKASFTLNAPDQESTLVFNLTVNDGVHDSLPLTLTIKHVPEEGSVTIPDNPATADEWQIDKIYVGGDKASWKGLEYKARWWTRGNEPGTNEVWQVVE